MNRRLAVAAASALIMSATFVGCSDSKGAAPGSRAGSTTCPTAGPVRASELDQLASCDLSGMEIVMDVWTSGEVGGAVQNIGSCSSASEGTPVVVCTFGTPVGTGGYVGDGSARVWFGTEDAILRVKAHSG